ncbi:MAG TPA: carbamoyltransferase C-terminal domain-containing protein, partial [Chitinophagales bacterium]|nr:carbamoyltransferase C-terminal domain-containing protein [Chitinophagales bacterium]
CRIQTVNANQNPLYYSFLKKLKEKTGYGVCLNTSFNLNYEPIVSTPQHALATFYASGLDALLIGNWLILK